MSQSVDRVAFTVWGKPYGKGRPRFARSGHAYTPKLTREYEELVKSCYILQCGDKMVCDEVPLVAEIRAYFPIPTSLSKKKQAELVGKAHIKKPDTDNVVKAILDGISGMAYRDDATIAEIHATKSYDAEPRVEVIIYSQ